MQTRDELKILVVGREVRAGLYISKIHSNPDFCFQIEYIIYVHHFCQRNIYLALLM